MEKQFYSLREAVDVTGLSYKYLRLGCLSGEIPCIRSGEGRNAKIYVNMPLLREKLDRKSQEA